MNFVQVCPTQPVNGSCPEPLVWVEVGSSLPLTYAEFAQLVPALVGILLTAWGIKILLRLIFNNR
jgi:hypothetical protein